MHISIKIYIKRELLFQEFELLTFLLITKYALYSKLDA